VVNKSTQNIAIFSSKGMVAFCGRDELATIAFIMYVNDSVFILLQCILALVRCGNYLDDSIINSLIEHSLTHCFAVSSAFTSCLESSSSSDGTGLDAPNQPPDPSSPNVLRSEVARGSEGGVEAEYENHHD
jgi:hypothetical protein